PSAAINMKRIPLYFLSIVMQLVPLQVKLYFHQPFHGGIQRFFFLGKTKPKHLIVLAIMIENRNRDRGNAEFFGETYGQLLIPLFANALIGTTDEITTR